MQTPGKQAFAFPGFKIAFLVTPTLLPFGVIGSVWCQAIHFDAIFPLIPLVPQENRIKHRISIIPYPPGFSKGVGHILRN